MAWYLNNIRITVIGLKEEQGQNLIELQPLQGGTVYQYFGYINKKFPLECLVVGSEDKLAIENLATTGEAYSLIGHDYDYGDFYVHKATFIWTPTFIQTFRPDKSREDLVFRGILELSRST